MQDDNGREFSLNDYARVFKQECAIRALSEMGFGAPAPLKELNMTLKVIKSIKSTYYFGNFGDFKYLTKTLHNHLLNRKDIALRYKLFFTAYHLF